MAVPRPLFSLLILLLAVAPSSPFHFCPGHLVRPPPLLPSSSTSLLASRLSTLTNNFFPYLEANAGKVSKAVTLASSDGGGDVSLVSTQVIPADSLLITVPVSLSVSLTNTEPPPSGSGIPSDVWKELPWYSQVRWTDEDDVGPPPESVWISLVLDAAELGRQENVVGRVWGARKQTTGLRKSERTDERF